MATSSIHIEPGNKGFFAHNSRERATNNTIFKDEQNFCSCTAKEAFQAFRNELKERSEAYMKRTNQKMQKNTVTHLSAILNFNKQHNENDIEKVCKYLEKELDTKVIQYALHRDEGHIAEDENIENHHKNVKNYHAHIEFMGLDSQGRSVRRKLDKAFLKKLQTDVANILGMERGQESGYTKEEYKEIIAKVGNPANFENKKKYKEKFDEVALELGYMKARKKPVKRLDTYEYKHMAQKLGEKEKEHKQEKAKNADLQKEVKKLRELLKEQGAGRPDYAQLEQLNRDLKQKIKDKNLSLEKMEEKIKELENKLILKEEDIEKLQQQINLLTARNNAYYGMNQNLKKDKKMLEKKLEKLMEKMEKNEVISDEEFQEIPLDFTMEKIENEINPNGEEHDTPMEKIMEKIEDEVKEVVFDKFDAEIIGKTDVIAEKLSDFILPENDNENNENLNKINRQR